MVVVTIALETAEDEAQLIELLPTVHGRIIAKDEPPTSLEELEAGRQRQKKALEAMRRLSEQGGGDLIR